MTAWAMRRTIYERDVLSEFRKRLLPEIAPEELRALCAKVKDRGAPATAIHTAISSSRSTGSPFCARYVHLDEQSPPWVRRASQVKC